MCYWQNCVCLQRIIYVSHETVRRRHSFVGNGYTIKSRNRCLWTTITKELRLGVARGVLWKGSYTTWNTLFMWYKQLLLLTTKCPRHNPDLLAGYGLNVNVSWTMDSSVRVCLWRQAISSGVVPKYGLRNKIFPKHPLVFLNVCVQTRNQYRFN